MRSKYRSRRQPSPAPSRIRATHVVIALVLVALGGSFALAAERFVPPAAGASPAASSPPAASLEAAAASADPNASVDPGASASAEPTATPAAPELEAQLPASVNGTTLSRQSATDAMSLSNQPNGRALDAAMTSLGKKASDLQVAVAYDGTGALDVSVLGFRVAGVASSRLREIVLDTWLVTSTPGVTTSSVTLSGVPATKVSYGDGGAEEYVFERGGSVFLVETSDQAVAQGVVAEMLKPGSTAASPAAPATAGTSPVPAASPSPAS